MLKKTEKNVAQKGSQRGTVPTIGEDRGGKLIFLGAQATRAHLIL